MSNAISSSPTRSETPQIPEAQVTSPKKRAEIGSITAIRCVPIIAVLIDHVFRISVHQTVSFFFILSGFVLVLSHGDISMDRRTLVKFSIARIARLWPAHVFCLLLLIYSCPQVFKVTKAAIPNFLTNLFLLQSWVPELKVFFSYNSPSWASSVLIAMAIAFPALMLVMRKSWKAALTLSAVPLLALVYICNALSLPEYSTTSLSMQGLLYINPLARIFEFAVGMATAAAFISITSKRQLTAGACTSLEILALTILLGGLAGATMLQQTTEPLLGHAGAYWLRNVGSTLLPLSLLFFALALQKGFVARLLDNRVMRYLGEVTFSIYMLHAVTLAYKSIHYPNVEEPMGMIVWFTTMMVGSVLMYSFVEKPLRKMILAVSARLV